MNIMHIMLACFYIDDYSYQENLLPKYHKELGNNVKIVASLFSFDKDGNGKWLDKAVQYTSNDEIPVSRLAFSKHKYAKRIRCYEGLGSELNSFKPDIIFVHGPQFYDVRIIAEYAKQHPDVVIYVDNHADFSNSAKSWVSKNIQHKILWKHCAKCIEPYTKKFYGVLPARVDFLKNVYRLPKSKIELLVMGADDELVKDACSAESIQNIRKELNIKDDDFLIMYGGKTDQYKKQVFLLMDAVNSIENPKVKLVIFGSVIPEMKHEIESRCLDRVNYIGWILAKDTYKYFAAADLACFPGRHSVFWEQVAAQGIPLLVKKWEGTTHVDCGGNIAFLTKDSSEEIKEKIENIVVPDNYVKFKSAAEKASKNFMYSNIAKRSIEE